MKHSSRGDEPKDFAIPDAYTKYGFGYLPDLYNRQDYRTDTLQVKKIYEKVPGLTIKFKKGKANCESAASVDLTKDFSPIRNQGLLRSCTAFSAAALVEYFQKKAYGSYTDASPRFIYKVSRNLLNYTGDTGAFPRCAMGALTFFGSPPEDYWPYNGEAASKNMDFDVEPSAFCYAFAQSYQTIKYVRLDQPDLSNNDLLKIVKHYVSRGFPLMFGFTVHESFEAAKNNCGEIPAPTENDRPRAGHTLVIAGYDDDKIIKSPNTDSTETGAFLVRNSMGVDWGDKGYGWLPYYYLLSGEAMDFWTIISQEWVNNIQFEK